MTSQLLFVCLVSAVAVSQNAIADTFPIIDARHGYLIGAIQSRKWLESNDAARSVKRGVKMPVYGVTGKIGSLEVLKVDTDNEPCPDRPIVRFRPRQLQNGEVAFAANWNPLPRKIQLIDAKQNDHADLVRDFLRQRGLREPIVHISQIASIDLDGDGRNEFIISATHYKNGDEIPDESSANTYSFVAVERIIDGKPKVDLVDGEFYPQPKPDAAPPNKFELAALLDLNGDGKIDIVLRSAYYEGDEISVYEYGSTGAKKVLSVGCGL